MSGTKKLPQGCKGNYHCLLLERVSWLTYDKSSRITNRAMVRPPLRPTSAFSLPKCTVKQVTYDVRDQHIGNYCLMHHKSFSRSPNWEWRNYFVYLLYFSNFTLRPLCRTCYSHKDKTITWWLCILFSFSERIECVHCHVIKNKIKNHSVDKVKKL